MRRLFSCCYCRWPPWLPGPGNGQYKNPVLYANYSAPDVVRVGQDYSLPSSSFDLAPGCPFCQLATW